MDDRALVIDDAEAVAVGVRGQPEVALLVPDQSGQLGQVLLGAGRGDAAEIGVDVAVDLLDRDVVLLQDLVEVLAARAVEQVDADRAGRTCGWPRNRSCFCRNSR